MYWEEGVLGLLAMGECLFRFRNPFVSPATNGLKFETSNSLKET